MLANFIKKKPQGGASKGDAAFKGDAASLGDPNSAVIKNYRYNTGRKGNDSGMNQRLSHQAKIERMEQVENPTFKQQRELMNAKAPWNPINRYATTGGYGQGVNLGQRFGEKQWDGGKEVTMGSMLKNAPGAAFELAAGGAKELFGEGGVANPVPALKGIAGIPLDVGRAADAFMQGASQSGYREPEWSKNSPSFVGGIAHLGKALYNDPGDTIAELALGEGAAFNLLGGAGALGKLGAGGRFARAGSVPKVPAVPKAPAVPKVATPPPATGALGQLGSFAKNQVKGALGVDNFGKTNRMINPANRAQQIARTGTRTAKDLYQSQGLNDPIFADTQQFPAQTYTGGGTSASSTSSSTPPPLQAATSTSATK